MLNYRGVEYHQHAPALNSVIHIKVQQSVALCAEGIATLISDWSCWLLFQECWILRRSESVWFFPFLSAITHGAVNSPNDKFPHSAAGWGNKEERSNNIYDQPSAQIRENIPASLVFKDSI